MSGEEHTARLYHDNGLLAFGGFVAISSLAFFGLMGYYATEVGYALAGNVILYKIMPAIMTLGVLIATIGVLRARIWGNANAK